MLKEICYVNKPRGREDIFQGQIVVIKDVGYSWGSSERGENDDNVHSALRVTILNISDEQLNLIEEKKVKVSKNGKKLIPLD